MVRASGRVPRRHGSALAAVPHLAPALQHDDRRHGGQVHSHACLHVRSVLRFDTDPKLALKSIRIRSWFSSRKRPLTGFPLSSLSLLAGVRLPEAVRPCVHMFYKDDEVALVEHECHGRERAVAMLARSVSPSSPDSHSLPSAPHSHFSLLARSGSPLGPGKGPTALREHQIERLLDHPSHTSSGPLSARGASRRPASPGGSE